MLANNTNNCAVTPQTIILLAAGSLSQAFRKVADAILNDYGLSLEAEFGSTARMAKLIREGSPCDVFASADMETPQKFVASEQVVPLVRNDMVAVARRDSGINSDGLPEFLIQARPLSIGISDPCTQPCGSNALKSLSHILPPQILDEKTRVITGGLDQKKAKAAGEKSDYTTALEQGADLLIVFRTTAQKVCKQWDQAQIIELPSPMQVTAQYGMAILNNSSAVQTFIDYLQSQKVRHIFKDYGFQ